MKLRHLLAGAWALALSLAGPAFAADDTLTSKDAAGVVKTMCSKDTAGIWAVCHVSIDTSGVKLTPAKDSSVDGLETLVGTTNSSLTTIDGRVDGLETLVTATNSALTAVTGTKAPGTAAASSLLTGGVYTSAGVTLTTGQQAALQLNASGSLFGAALSGAYVDGWNATLGAKADAAATDETSTASEIAILKALLREIRSTTASAVNLTQVGGTTLLTGNGVTGAGSQRVTIASDNTAFAIKFSQTTTDNDVDAAIADGGSITLGAKADSTCGTATGTCSEIALIKYLNSQLSTALPAGTNVIGKVGIDQTTPGTTNGVQVNAALPAGTNIVGYTSTAFDVATTITRPANTTAYTANDVLGGAIDLGVLGNSASTIEINSVQLEADVAAIPAGQTTWVLYLYSVTPPSATADNGAFDLPSGDRASFLGSVALSALADLGSTLYVETNFSVPKQLKLSGTHLFGYLQTVGGFTPAANSEVYKLTVHTRVR